MNFRHKKKLNIYKLSYDMI